MLEKGEIDPKSKSTAEIIQSLVGETHAESRSFVSDLKFHLAKKEISITEEQAIALSKLPKHVPLLDKTKFQADRHIIKESKINPLLVKGKTTELPKVVKDHLEKIKQEE